VPLRDRGAEWTVEELNNNTFLHKQDRGTAGDVKPSRRPARRFGCLGIFCKLLKMKETKINFWRRQPVFDAQLY
jgi:hypothetical protein